MNAAMVRGLRRTPVDTWLSVIPQLIARIHNPVKGVRDGVCDLLDFHESDAATKNSSTSF